MISPLDVQWGSHVWLGPGFPLLDKFPAPLTDFSFWFHTKTHGVDLDSSLYLISHSRTGIQSCCLNFKIYPQSVFLPLPLLPTCYNPWSSLTWVIRISSYWSSLLPHSFPCNLNIATNMTQLQSRTDDTQEWEPKLQLWATGIYIVWLWTHFLALSLLCPPFHLQWPPHSSLNMPSILPSQDVCIHCFLFQKGYFPKYLCKFPPYLFQVCCTNIDFWMPLHLKFQLLHTFPVSIPCLTLSLYRVLQLAFLITVLSYTLSTPPPLEGDLAKSSYFLFIHSGTSSSLD